jgi:hypothetical protein
MRRQLGLWDEPVRAGLWERLPAAAREQMVALFARLAAGAARTASGSEAETRKGDRHGRNAQRDTR